MASDISVLNMSYVDWEILPVSSKVSKACFFFFAISYSSFSFPNECFHEINSYTVSSLPRKMEITFVNMLIYRSLFRTTASVVQLKIQALKNGIFQISYSIKDRNISVSSYLPNQDRLAGKNRLVAMRPRNSLTTRQYARAKREIHRNTKKAHF
jgi:hypothetical protein